MCLLPAGYAIRIIWTEWSHKWISKNKRKRIAPEELLKTKKDNEFNNPVVPDLFCGECGARSSPDSDEFCNECGAPSKDFVVAGDSSWGSMEMEI